MTDTNEPEALSVDEPGDQIVPVSSGLPPLRDLELVREEQTARKGDAPRRNISRGRLVWRRFLRKRLAVFGLIVLIAEALLAYLGPLLTKWKVGDIDPLAFGNSPGGSHWWGTDDQGHDMFVQTMSGTQKSLLVGLIAAVVSTLIAAVVGSVAGYFRRTTDNVLMWFVNLMM